MYHPLPRGIGSAVNETYFTISNSPILNDGLALRMEMYSGDFSKDSSDSHQGIKCPCSKISTGCNLLGQCDDYLALETPYVIQFDFMIKKYVLGFDFCFFNIAGPHISICYFRSAASSAGSYWITHVPPIANLDFVKIAKLTAAAPEISSWSTWRIEYQLSVLGAPSYFNVFQNNVEVGKLDINTASVALKPGTQRRIDVGISSIHADCATADMEVYLRHLVAVSGTSIPDALTPDVLVQMATTPVAPVIGKTKSNNDDPSLYEIFPTMEGGDIDSRVKAQVKVTGKVTGSSADGVTISVAVTVFSVLFGFLLKKY